MFSSTICADVERIELNQHCVVQSYHTGIIFIFQQNVLNYLLRLFSTTLSYYLHVLDSERNDKRIDLKIMFFACNELSLNSFQYILLHYSELLFNNELLYTRQLLFSRAAVSYYCYYLSYIFIFYMIENFQPLVIHPSYLWLS